MAGSVVARAVLAVSLVAIEHVASDEVANALVAGAHVALEARRFVLDTRIPRLFGTSTYRSRLGSKSKEKG